MSKMPKQKPSKQDSPTAIIQQLLSRSPVHEIEFDEVTSQFSKFASSARDASQPNVAAAAETLGQLSELACADAQADNDGCVIAENIVAFLQDHLDTVCNCSQNEDSAVAEIVAQAKSSWGDYLDAFADFTADESSDNDWAPGFETGDQPNDFSGDAAEGNLPADENYGSQIDLMLSAIGGLESSESLPETTPASNNEPAAATVDAEIFDGSSESTPADHAAIDADARQRLQVDRELLDAYLDDANRCLESMERSVLSLDSGNDHAEPVRQFCRELHTLKGASATVGLSGLATFLHNLETSLEGLFEGDQCHADADQLLTAVDAVRESIQSLDPTPSPAQPAADSSASQPATAVAPTAPRKPLDFSSHSGGDEASIRIRASRLDRLMDMLAELVVLRNRRESHVTEFNRLNEELTRCATRLRLIEGNTQNIDDTGSPEQAAASSQMLFGVTQEISRDIAELSTELRSVQKPISTDNQAISRFVRDFRQELMQLRRMPVSGLFQRLQRAARDAGKVESKQVKVQLVGAETGLEQELQEQLYEPLMHIVRNAVGHGIETPEQRKIRGKASAGTITLEAKSSAQLLVIEIRDDGNGLDYDAVRKRARDKGLIPAHATPSEAELARLIFHPGFSTQTQVSELSGRGVGMDVVATAIDQLHGRIEITSQAGVGTTMRLSIPLRSGIEHVLVFRSAGQLFALPMQSVHASRQLDAATEIKQADRSRLNLSEILDLRDDENHKSQRGQQLITLRALEQSLAGEKTGKSRRSLAVDEIVGPEEVVVRSLPVFLNRHPLFCGVTLSGTGETVMLIDSNRLDGFCDQYSRNQTPADTSQQSNPQTSATQPTALVVDDSLSARKHLVRKLQAGGYLTTEANDGMAALEVLRENNFDAIFTDLDMPQLGGLELLAELQTGRHRDTPAVVVSSRAESEFREQAKEAGAIEYLVKPAADEQLKSILGQLEARQLVAAE